MVIGYYIAIYAPLFCQCQYKQANFRRDAHVAQIALKALTCHAGDRCLGLEHVLMVMYGDPYVAEGV